LHVCASYEYGDARWYELLTSGHLRAAGPQGPVNRGSVLRVRPPEAGRFQTPE